MHAPLHAARHGALLVVRDDLRGLVVTGPDRTSWLSGLVTNDLAPLRDGACTYGLALNKQGKILSEVVSLARGDAILAGVHAPSVHETCDHLDHFLIMEDAEIALWDEPHRWILSFGPHAAAVADAARAVDGVLAAAPGPVMGYPGGVIVTAARPLHDLAPSFEQATGAPVRIISDAEFDDVRIDLGIPRCGPDFGPNTYPADIGLDDRAISFNKGCYLGQEVVVKLRARGKPVRALRRLLLPAGGTTPSPGDEVTLASGKAIGTVSSAALSHVRGAPIAYALVRRAEAESGEPIRVNGVDASIRDAWDWADA